MNRQDALDYHASPRPGKIAVVPTKPLTNQRDLSLAYSPGVAEPCLEIERDPERAYKYTAQGQPRRRRHQRHRRPRARQHRRAGRQAGHGGQGKPLQAVRRPRRVRPRGGLARIRTTSSGSASSSSRRSAAINLEDIRAPDCFCIEETLRKTMKHPGLPRRPARHRDHLRRRAAQRARGRREEDRRSARRVLGRGRGGDRHGEHYVRLGVRRSTSSCATAPV